jgi:hypothetical protein
MNAIPRTWSWLVGFAVLSGALFLAGRDSGAQQTDPPKPEIKKVDVGKNVWLEIEGDKRRVVVNAVVVRRADLLEQFMCRKETKEHESIVAVDCDVAKIHFALTLAGADPGSPVKYSPKYMPAHGTVIKVYVQYKQKDQVIKVPAQQWVRNVKTKKELEHDWVFAGSQLYPNRLDPKAPPIYEAHDSGYVICVANFPSAMLDLPVLSSKDNDDLQYEAFTERIPAEKTPVQVILEPVLPPKKK